MKFAIGKANSSAEHGYFAFGDLNVRDLGKYQLKFTLFEIRCS